jgi:ankyrin repeat protein/Mg2+ and Co2+ transporter CorA
VSSAPLHWACATGKKHFAEKLLSRPRHPGANVNATEIRSKTSLHIAAAHDRDDLVELLLTYHADVNARSDGGWTPLHNACEKGSEKIVRMLLQAGAEINSKLLNGMTALHLAAQGGHADVVKCLLECKDVKLTARDTFGSTPLLRAAQFRRKDIVQLLAPYNHVEALSEDALGACNGFDATIVDFGNYHNENQVKRRTVYELLYGRDPKDSTKHAISTLPGNVKATRFRWIHLPANNMVWVEELLTKIFIEEGAGDVEGFKALEKSFSHQHRGQRIHSHFMRPLSQSTPRAPRQDEDDETEQMTPSIVVNGATKEDKVPETPVRISKSGSDQSNCASHIGLKNHATGSHNETKGKRRVKRGTDAPKSEQGRKSSLQLANSIVRSRGSPGSPSRKDIMHFAKSNIYTFMPYLHFETDTRRQEMQEAIRHAENLQARPALTKARTYDEMLLRAHLRASNTSLHVRRTLDQFFYHNIDTQSRDCDQVVYRYQTRGRDQEDPRIDPKVFMVDQLWMWTLGKDLIVTSFPQRWQQPKNDPLNVLDNIIEDINSKTREPVKSVYDLAMIITGRCCGAFDRHRMGDADYQFLDMFESSIGSATDRETTLFNEFNDASVQASEWLKHHRRPNRFSRKLESSGEKEDKFKFEDHNRRPLFVDKLLDIGQEIKLLTEIKDIRDELNMIRMVLQYQLQVLPDLQEAICDIFKEEHRSHQEVKKHIKDQQKIVDVHIKDLDRMDRQAERIYDSITDLLDLKQKHANAFEARFARDQAAGTARQGQTIMVFTIVTIIFLPLSFIAAFFAIDIQEFPRNGDGSQRLHLSYVAKYMFGIGFAISIPLVLVALSLDDIGDLYREAIRRLRRKILGRDRQPPQIDDAGRAVGFLKMEQASRVARSAGGSMETSWVGSLLPVARRTTGESERSRRHFMFRNSVDIERRDRLRLR